MPPKRDDLSWPSEDSIAADLVIDDLCDDDSSDDGDDGF